MIEGIFQSTERAARRLYESETGARWDALPHDSAVRGYWRTQARRPVPDPLLTIEEAASILDPPMPAEALRALVEVAGLPARGIRRTGRPGRPAQTYPAGPLMRIHAALAPIIHEFRAESEVKVNGT